ncbi:cell division protein ZapE [Pseudomonas sp. Marseille-P9899]|uniref:cell division protein ZapE n=1 Tax=Pseudomonas sp. Marseille-P9899 TaxID=2730401 RepID=UPI00158AB46F|nr:cell division protein ZapE [Pseudomonas sp. Marseille-P9899]
MPVFSWLRSPLHALRQRLGASTVATPGPDSQIQAYFRDKASQQGYTLSQGQQRVIAAMAEQVARLPAGRARSLYLHGQVGRGKSWLLDGFFNALGEIPKRRLHFHDFFARLHQGMFDHRQAPDALALTLDALLGDCRVLCFDEFHVHDIGDAMLLTRLFQALFERRIFVLVTSNYAPEGLLPNPLYHQRFEPVIRLIEARMDVLEVGGDQDYRALPGAGTQQRFTQGLYLWPGSPQQRHQLGLNDITEDVLLNVGKRQLHARVRDEHSVVFDFSAICEQATAVIDYLDLVQRFEHWTIEHLPNLEDCTIAAQQRFINLVDVLYDRDKQLLLIGELPLEQSLGGSVADLARTRSRLGQLRQMGPA